MTHLLLKPIDYALVVLYFGFVLGIGWVVRRRVADHASSGGSSEFLTAARSLPAWVTGLAFISANLGAQEVIGMGASGAKYGLMTSHFYWIGAIPAMVFLGVFMMPFYYGSKARSVPEYLKLRFDEKTRGFTALTFAFMTIVSSGISMHALASLLRLLLGWPYMLCILLCAGIVLVYIFLGGLSSAIYNEVLQFCLIVAGFAPLVFLGLKDLGGWSALKAKLVPVALAHGFAPGTWSESWSHLDRVSANPMGVEWFGLAMGLGFVLSFGYWCTDFLVVQRALAADSLSAARRTPLIAAVPKMFFPALLIVPGMIAAVLDQAGGSAGGALLPLAADGSPDYNMSIPSLLIHYFPSGLLGIGLTALIASFMSGMAGNVTAFNTVWTYDVYQSYLAPGKSDRHYLSVAHAATVGGIALSVGTAYLAASFNNIMDLLQLVFVFVNAPLFATFLLGMLSKHTTSDGAFFGLIGGTGVAALFHGLSLPLGAGVGIKGGWIDPRFVFASPMGQNFYMAIAACGSCLLLTAVISLVTPRTKGDVELKGLVYSLTPRIRTDLEPWYRRPAVLGGLVLAGALILNIAFR
jgi:solute:Na+ symporter, SSS family